MKRKLKVIIASIITTLMLVLTLTVNVHASEYDAIQTEVSTLVAEGKLPSYHNYLSNNSGYQTFYTKMYRQGDNELREYFASLSYSELSYKVKWYENEWDSVWYDILTNLDIEPQYLDPNKLLGLYYDADAGETYSYLYLIWTSKYLPSEFMTVHEFDLNGKHYSQYPDGDLFNAFWYDSKYYYFEKYDLAIHISPIGGYDSGEQFGVPLTQKYKFQNIKTGIDKLQFDRDPDPYNKYSAEFSSDAVFDLGLVPKYHEKSACQLVTHAYQLIKDCEVQSHYDFGFGGYMHYVHFNTSIPIDKIYRVDVSYILTSDNKEWYQFWLEEDEQRVTKSMRPDKKSTGIFGLYDTYGFKEGTFKSNAKESITYKYEMMLNFYCIYLSFTKPRSLYSIRINV